MTTKRKQTPTKATGSGGAATVEVPTASMRLACAGAVKLSGDPAATGAEADGAQVKASGFRMEPALKGHIPGHWYYGELHVELTGIETPRQVPALHEHMSDRRVGFTTKLSIDPKVGLIAEGTLLDNPQADEIRRDAQAGFPWEASVHLQALAIEEVGRGVTAKVNGADVVGPATIFRKSRLREVSFVTIGYDPETSAQAFSGSAAKVAVPVTRNGTTMDETETTTPPPVTAAAPAPADPVADERKRVAAILSAALPEQGELAQKMIADGTPLADALLAINADMRQRIGQSRAPETAAAFEAGDTALAASGRGTGNDPAVSLGAMPEKADPALWARWQKDAKLRAEYVDDFSVFAAYERTRTAGRLVQLDPQRAEASIIR